MFSLLCTRSRSTGQGGSVMCSIVLPGFLMNSVRRGTSAQRGILIRNDGYALRRPDALSNKRRFLSRTKGLLLIIRRFRIHLRCEPLPDRWVLLWLHRSPRLSVFGTFQIYRLSIFCSLFSVKLEAVPHLHYNRFQNEEVPCSCPEKTDSIHSTSVSCCFI